MAFRVVNEATEIMGRQRQVLRWLTDVDCAIFKERFLRSHDNRERTMALPS
jgi:hypothetical protein